METEKSNPWSLLFDPSLKKSFQISTKIVYILDCKVINQPKGSQLHYFQPQLLLNAFSLYMVL